MKERALLLILYSPNPNTYVNVITHCVKYEGVTEIYFGCEKVKSERKYEAVEEIGRIKECINQFALSNSLYENAKNVFPEAENYQKNIYRLDFLEPHSELKKIEKGIKNSKNMIVDITGCGKRLAADIVTSYLANGIKHVCHFELSDKVYEKEWRENGKSKMIHDLIEGGSGIKYYEYDNFADTGATSDTLKKLSSRGFLSKLFMGISLLALLALFFVIKNEGNEERTTLIILGISVLTSTFAFFNSVTNIFSKVVKI